ncbi:hypothetical protein V1525DRAFT_413527 [Lipomyces kononenkoae]|uniref:Uncharacterized protein n=1 Tax=Lipomyces kononenkoae TaxID=34357 RepID=A0ACC3SRT5_LIPKO
MADLIFITGGSGHIGYRVILYALASGYRVRAAVRSKDRAEKIVSSPSIKALGVDNDKDERLQFVEVPDLSSEDAYDEAIKDAQYAIHVASPITASYKEGDDLVSHFMEPALTGTMNLLKAAQKAGSVRRVVVTSSVVAIIPWQSFTSGTSAEIFNEKNRISTPEGPFSNTFEAYAAGKTAALNKAEAWLHSEKPSLELIHVFPGFVIGPNELVTNVKDALYGTNRSVLGPILGEDGGRKPSSSIHVSDVAMAHVLALSPHINSHTNSGFILSSEGLRGTRWEESLQLAKQYFPNEVEQGILPTAGTVGTLPVKIDASQTEKVLGLKLRSFEEQVKDILSYYVQLARG